MVLDVNYFPSYKELKQELPGLLRKHFTSLVAKKQQAATAPDTTEPPLATGSPLDQPDKISHIAPRKAE